VPLGATVIVRCLPTTLKTSAFFVANEAGNVFEVLLDDVCTFEITLQKTLGEQWKISPEMLFEVKGVIVGATSESVAVLVAIKILA
jgi:hypothetical protein